MAAGMAGGRVVRAEATAVVARAAGERVAVAREAVVTAEAVTGGVTRAVARAVATVAERVAGRVEWAV